MALYTRIEGKLEEMDGWLAIKNGRSVTKLLMLIQIISYGQDETVLAILSLLLTSKCETECYYC